MKHLNKFFAFTFLLIFAFLISPSTALARGIVGLKMLGDNPAAADHVVTNNTITIDGKTVTTDPNNPNQYGFGTGTGNHRVSISVPLEYGVSYTVCTDKLVNGQLVADPCDRNRKIPYNPPSTVNINLPADKENVHLWWHFYPLAEKTCEINSVSASGQTKTVTYSGNNGYVEAWVVSPDGQPISEISSSVPTIVVGSSTYYRIGRCDANSRRCTNQTASFQGSTNKSYKVWCNVFQTSDINQSNPYREDTNKCSGNPVCTFNGGTTNCAPEWRKCSTNDNRVIAPGDDTVASYRIAEDPAKFDIPQGQDGYIPPQAYPVNGEVDYRFSNANPGPKNIWVEFKSVSGSTERHGPVPIQLVNFSCTSTSPEGLSVDSSDPGPGGIPTYPVTGSWVDGFIRKRLNINRTPAEDTTISNDQVTKMPDDADNLIFENAADGGGNKWLKIPSNSRSTTDVYYTVPVTIRYNVSTNDGPTKSCPSFRIKVPKATADTTCPANIQSTKARMQLLNSQGSWTTDLTIDSGQSVYIGGFHDNQITTYATDTALTITGPAGGASNTQNLGVGVTVPYTPPAAGVYTVTAAVPDKTGDKCTGSATLTVNPPAVVTTSYRMAEDPSQFNIPAGQPNAIPWQPYTREQLSIEYQFKNKTPGPKFIFVQFMDSTGKMGGCGDNQTQPCSIQVKVLGADPVANCSLSFEGNNTILNLTGQNFGAARGIAKTGDTDLQVREWKNSSVKLVWPDAPVGQVLPVTVTTSDGQSVDVNCSASSLLSIDKAKVVCQSTLRQDISNVDLTLAGLFKGGTVFKQKVTIDKNGIIQSLTQRLEVGKKYKLSLKVAGALRKTTDEFTAADSGVTNIPSFSLPVGDIFPPDGGDNVINSADRAELNRQWSTFADVSGRSGDLNKDGRINSADWACMRLSFNASEDSEPTAGAPAVGGPAAAGSTVITPATTSANLPTATNSATTSANSAP